MRGNAEHTWETGHYHSSEETKMKACPHCGEVLLGLQSPEYCLNNPKLSKTISKTMADGQMATAVIVDLG